MRIQILVTTVAILLYGCASNTLENPNLLAKIDSNNAEVVGSKLIGEGGIPHQIYAGWVDGKQLRHVAVDQTLKIWPIAPGIHEFNVAYSGSTGKVFIRPFFAEGKLTANLQAGHRYIVRIRREGESSIKFFFEDSIDRSVAGESNPVPLVGITFTTY